ncbi:hypothetical protein [Acetobacter persici]|nr:hypothetical protein [Acetobacter persici]
MIKADTDKCKFLDFMIAKALEKCGNTLFYHNYQHMMDVVINSTILTCMWISEGRLGDDDANASDVLLSMALAAAFHDTVMEHRSAPGQSEELSAQFLRETYSLYLCLRPDLAANRFCADPVEVAYGLISYTVPNIRTELRSRLDAFPPPFRIRTDAIDFPCNSEPSSLTLMSWNPSAYLLRTPWGSPVG